MEYLTLEKIGLVAGMLLVMVGLYGILTRKNIIKIIIGFTIFDTGIHVIMVSLAYMKNATAPILDASVDRARAAELVADPIPQALVLTAIVIGLGVTALMLGYAMKMYKSKGTLDINSYTDLKW